MGYACFVKSILDGPLRVQAGANVNQRSDRRASKPRRDQQAERDRTQRQLVLRLKLICVFALMTAVIAGLALYWDRIFPVPVERQIAVYRTHDCACVGRWIRELKEAGFAVQDFEPETLRPIRRSLHVPERLGGCHVAKYLGYFVEGHISAEALQSLASQRPDAAGIALETDVVRHASSAQDEKGSAVLLLGAHGESSRWLN